MTSFAAKALRASGLIAFFLLTTAGIPTNGIPTNGIPTNGIPTNGIPTNGIPTNGIPTNGIPTNGIPTNGIPTNAANLELLERSLLFANKAVHEALIGKAFTQASLTDPTSAVFQVWSDPYSTILLAYLWQDAHAAGDNLFFVGPSGNTFRFYGNLGLCDRAGTGWARNTPLDDGCAKWLSATNITQINQSGIHNLFSARGPSSALASAIGPQLTDMSPAMLSFDYKFATHDVVESLHDVCARGTTGPENCGWQPGPVGTGTPGAVVKVSIVSNGVAMIAQVNQGIMGHDYPWAAKGSCAGMPAGCVDPDVLGSSVTGTVDPFLQFTIPPSGVFNVQWTTFSRDALKVPPAWPLMTAQVVGSSGVVRFPSDELDVFPSTNREMTASGNIFGSANIDPGLWSCEARLVSDTGTAYNFTPFDAPNSSLTAASGINDVGQIVGTLKDTSTAQVKHAFLRSMDGTIVSIDPTGATSAIANGINNAGQVVGSFVGTDGQLHGFERMTDGTFTTIDFAGAKDPFLEAINDAGQMVGSYSVVVGEFSNSVGFFRDTVGTVTTIAVSGAAQTQPFAINNRGQIAGYYYTSSGSHGFLRDTEGFYNTIDVSGAAETFVTGLNDAGFVSGTFRRSDCGTTPQCFHGFVRSPTGQVTQVDVPASVQTEALAINSSGTIAGSMSNARTLKTVAFVTTLSGTQLCDATNTTSCTTCTRSFAPGAAHVIFPNAHLWLSRNWNNAQDYYHNRSCSSDLSTCVASFEGYIDAPWANPATGRTVSPCQVQSSDADSHLPLPYLGTARPLSDANSCFVDTAVQSDFAVTTFFPNYRDFGACGAIGSSASASCAYSKRRIAFASTRTGNGDIYVMNGDGANPTLLAGNPAPDFSPALNPDGRRVAFVSTRTGNGDIYIADADNPGAAPMLIAGDPAVDFHPVWNPTGDKLAFVSTRSGNGDVYLVNSDGTGLRNITNNPAADFDPAFSSDGRKLVFTSTRTGSGNLYMVDLADPTLTPVRLTTSSSFDFGASFSPDGKTIVFVRAFDPGVHIYLLDVATHAVTPLAASWGADFSPVFSSDGKRVAFVSTRTGNSDVWIVNVDGTGLRNLTSNPAQDFSPVFSPDGTQLAFVSTRDGNLEIYAADVATGQATNLTHNPALDAEPSWK
jgi:probable HAF family extracellular repeat protein